MTKKERVTRIDKLMKDVKQTHLSCLDFLSIMFDDSENTCVVIDIDNVVNHLINLPSPLITAIFNDLKKDFNI